MTDVPRPAPPPGYSTSVAAAPVARAAVGSCFGLSMRPKTTMRQSHRGDYVFMTLYFDEYRQGQKVANAVDSISRMELNGVDRKCRSSFDWVSLKSC